MLDVQLETLWDYALGDMSTLVDIQKLVGALPYKTTVQPQSKFIFGWMKANQLTFCPAKKKKEKGKLFHNLKPLCLTLN